MTDKTFHNILRALDDEPDDWAEVTVKLVDALRDYIRSHRALADELYREDEISKDTYDRAGRDLIKYDSLLADLENHEVDMTLHGLIAGKCGK